MRVHIAGRWAAGLCAALACAASTALADASAGERWVPVLAVFGEELASPGGGSAQGAVVLVPTSATASLGVARPLPDVAPRIGAAEGDEISRFVPSISVFSGVVGQDGSATVQSNVRPAPPDTGELITGDKTFVSPFVGGEAELMLPGLTMLPFSPRAFVRGGAQGNFGFKRDVAKEGSPGEFVFPALSPGTRIQESFVLGQGSTTSAKPDALQVTAGAGVAFTVDVAERRLRIKPSVEYLREEMKVAGTVHRAQALVGFPTTPEQFRLIELTGSGSKVYHGLGPGLEVEMDAARAGPVMLTVLGAGRAYRFLNDDRSVTFTTTNELGDTATWSFKKNLWAFLGSVGLRFRWVGE